MGATRHTGTKSGPRMAYECPEEERQNGNSRVALHLEDSVAATGHK